MIDFDEELKKYQPIPETGDVEEIVYNKELTDMTDIMKEMLKESKNKRQ